jgi:host factor-I protein
MPQSVESDKGAKVRSDGRTENAQFMFLNRLRKERSRVEVYLVSGTRLQGRIQSFDGRMLLLATETGVIALYHQATATVQRSLARPRRGMPRSQEDRPRKVMLRPRSDATAASDAAPAELGPGRGACAHAARASLIGRTGHRERACTGGGHQAPALQAARQARRRMIKRPVLHGPAVVTRRVAVTTTA